ncbi:DUF1707 SHOCT-like domain-containing protein [Hoyosella subflava]|uniref:DUF1707 domain-containing protein n=1 Tax=Hoyosella subflava (strain DSM 45089 / JCM 17490 / NBRC 109087 / DQS3-9A1) TaxID=443218 RepID=F6EQM8_HOYSD|nr:DUF1707 domain-containing protein [Hoyosella subflava]AEF41905.1 hypothetical protein AS9A_3464 [Hoyosella subflava DQS3-9A1]
MSESADDELLLSDDERLHALNVLSEHYAAGRLNVDEFYEQSSTVASARTLDGLRDSFRGLPGGVPLESVEGFIRKIQDSERLPAPKQHSDAAKVSPQLSAESEIASLKRRGNLVESLDWIIIGVTLVTFLILQFVLDFDYAWIVWPSLIFTLSIPRMILHYSDSDEEVYEELKEADAKERKKRLKKAAARIQELERRNSRTDE